MTDSTERLVDSLRGQIVERVKAQQQLVLVSAAVAGATLSFASELLSEHPEVMALLCLLYVGISLALLRHDQEITIIAGLLLDPKVFGPHATAQAHWEAHKFVEMQKGIPALIKSGAQTAGNYGVPILGVVATFAATVIAGPNLEALIVLGFALLFGALFGFGAVDVVQRYSALGTTAQELLNSGAPPPSSHSGLT